MEILKYTHLNCFQIVISSLLTDIIDYHFLWGQCGFEISINKNKEAVATPYYFSNLEYLNLIGFKNWEIRKIIFEKADIDKIFKVLDTKKKVGILLDTSLLKYTIFFGDESHYEHLVEIETQNSIDFYIKDHFFRRILKLTKADLYSLIFASIEYYGKTLLYHVELYKPLHFNYDIKEILKANYDSLSSNGYSQNKIKGIKNGIPFFEEYIKKNSINYNNIDKISVEVKEFSNSRYNFFRLLRKYYSEDKNFTQVLTYLDDSSKNWLILFNLLQKQQLQRGVEDFEGRISKRFSILYEKENYLIEEIKELIA